MHPVTDKKLPVPSTVDSEFEHFIPQEATVKNNYSAASGMRPRFQICTRQP